MNDENVKSRPFWLIALVLALLVFVFSFLGVAPLMDHFSPHDTGALFVFFCFGVIGAAAVLLGVYGVFGPGHLILRTGVTVGGAAVFFVLWALGYHGSLSAVTWDSYQRFLKELLAALFTLPIIYLAIASPLWMLRVLFGWRIVAVGDAKTPGREALTIRDVMLVTGMVAVALSSMRLAGHLLPEPFSDFLIVMAITVACCAGITLVGPVPFVAAILRPRYLVLGMLCSGIYIALAMPFTFLIMRWTRNVPPWDMIGIPFTILAFAGSQVAFLAICQKLGYRLTWGRKPAAAHRDGDVNPFLNDDSRKPYDRR